MFIFLRPLLFNKPRQKWESDNNNGKSYKYVCSNQPDTKSNSNSNQNHNHTTKQHTVVSIQLSMSYVSREIRMHETMLLHRFLLLSVVIVILPPWNVEKAW